MARDNLYNRVVNISRAAYTVDALGGNSAATWSVLWPRIPCRFNTLTTKEMTFTYDKQTVFANFYCYLEYLSALKEGDRLTDVNDGHIYEVKLLMEWDKARNYMKIAVMEIR